MRMIAPRLIDEGNMMNLHVACEIEFPIVSFTHRII